LIRNFIRAEYKPFDWDISHDSDTGSGFDFAETQTALLFPPDTGGLFHGQKKTGGYL